MMFKITLEGVILQGELVFYGLQIFIPRSSASPGNLFCLFQIQHFLEMVFIFKL